MLLYVARCHIFVFFFWFADVAKLISDVGVQSGESGELSCLMPLFLLLATIHTSSLIHQIFLALHCKSLYLWNYLICFRVLLLNILLSVAKHNRIHCACNSWQFNAEVVIYCLIEVETCVYWC